MKIVERQVLIDRRPATSTGQLLDELEQAVSALRWPPGSEDFAIYPESGKRAREGNGVKPIAEAFAELLSGYGWSLEAPFPIAASGSGARLGAMDASKPTARDGSRPFVVEWETGNISSSHRSLNKLALGLLARAVAGGVLIVPTRDLARYLTDRIGNFRELVPYFPLWEALGVDEGYLAIWAIEHDRESREVPRIAKGTAGRATR